MKKLSNNLIKIPELFKLVQKKGIQQLTTYMRFGLLRRSLPQSRILGTSHIRKRYLIY